MGRLQKLIAENFLMKGDSPLMGKNALIRLKTLPNCDLMKYAKPSAHHKNLSRKK